jgi:hypothetical protein
MHASRAAAVSPSGQLRKNRDLTPAFLASEDYVGIHFRDAVEAGVTHGRHIGPACRQSASEAGSLKRLKRTEGRLKAAPTNVERPRAA